MGKLRLSIGILKVLRQVLIPLGSHVNIVGRVEEKNVEGVACISVWKQFGLTRRYALFSRPLRLNGHYRNRECDEKELTSVKGIVGRPRQLLGQHSPACHLV